MKLKRVKFEDIPVGAKYCFGDAVLFDQDLTRTRIADGALTSLGKHLTKYSHTDSEDYIILDLPTDIIE